MTLPDERRISVVTDTGVITRDIVDKVTGSDLILLESNHDKAMLNAGPYPYHLKKRILSNEGHLSNDDCAAFVHELAESGTKSFMLAHISGENNRPELALDCAKSALSDFPDARVMAAKPDVETVLVN